MSEFETRVNSSFNLTHWIPGLYGLDCTSYQTCDESFITLYTIYFWIVVGPMVALTAFVAWVLCVGAICLRMSMA